MIDRADKPKLLLTPREAADALSICEKTLWSMTVPRGDLASIRIGRSVRYSVAELEAWIAARQDAQTAPLNGSRAVTVKAG